MPRSNNWSIPILVGADFNMDMRNFDLSEHPGTQFITNKFLTDKTFLIDYFCPEINIVPYRPKSGKNRGMKNTFLFTMDNIQVNSDSDND